MDQLELDEYVILLEETLDLISTKEINLRLITDSSVEEVNLLQKKIENLELRIARNMFWITEFKKLRPD